MSLIQVSHLTFGYEGSPDFVFEDVSFQIDTRWKLGLIGRNGCGKTTLLHLLMGEYLYQGNISHSVAFSYFPFPSLSPESITIDIITEIAPHVELWCMERELALLHTHTDILYRPFGTLSHGERTKVLLACLFLKENHFLLIDEPTNHLDDAARENVCSYLKNKNGFILVSHDRQLLNQCTDHTLSINRKTIELQKGNYRVWHENHIRQEHYERKKNESLKKEIQRLSSAAEKTSAWARQTEASKFGKDIADRGFIGHKAAKMMKRSKGIEARRENARQEKESLLKDLETVPSLAFHPLEYPKPILMETKNLQITYSTRQRISIPDLQIHNGERIVLRGKNGAGKSSVLKLILGDAVPYSGLVRIGSGLRISYIPQDTAHLHGGMREFILHSGIEEALFKTILRKLGFSREQFEKDLSALSEGQKKKICIARSLCERAHLYLWDEPLNFIDILSRMQLEEAILACCPTMILIEHDPTFQTNIATRTVTLDDKK